MVFDWIGGAATRGRAGGRERLFTTTALTVTTFCAVLAQGVHAQTLTDPVQTADTGDFILNEGETLSVVNGPAVTVNSDAAGDSGDVFVNNGTIEVTSPSNQIGVLVESGFTGNILNDGDISLVSALADDDLGGDANTGVLVSGAGTYTGNFTFETGSSIVVEGDGSRGVSIDAGLDGDFVNRGIIDINGDETIGVLVTGPVNGDLNFAGGQIDVSGANAVGVSVQNTVSGSIINGGTISAVSIVDDFVNDPDTTDDDDFATVRAVMEVGASVSGGFVNAGPAAEGDVGNQALQGNLDGNLAEFGVLISPTVSNGLGGDIVLGAAGDGESAFGFINRGLISADALDDANSATGVRIEGAEIGGTLLTTTIEGGILNTGSITSSTVDVSTAALSFGAGASVPRILNTGTITATSTSSSAGFAEAIRIESGAAVPILENEGTIAASVLGTEAASVTIQDLSGSLTLIDNKGCITQGICQPDLIAVVETPDRIAIDLSSTIDDVTIRNAGVIRGDIQLGSGDDVFEGITRVFEADTAAEGIGAVFNGVLNTGAGNDVVTLNDDAIVFGGIVNGGDTLDLTVEGASVLVPVNNQISVTNATFGTDSLLSLAVSDDPTESANVVATGTVELLDNAALDVQVSSFLSEPTEFTLIDAGTLNIADSVDLDAVTLPFLFNGSVAPSATDPSDLILSVDLKTPEELELNNNQTAAFPALTEALSVDDGLTVALGALDSNEAFGSAVNQLLPASGLVARTIAVTLTDQTTAAIANRLNGLRNVNSQDRSTAWFQIFGSIYEKDQVDEEFGFDGETYSVAAGMDFAWLGANAIGAGFVWSGSVINEMDSFDEDFRADTIQVGTYGSWSWGKAFLDVQAFAGYNIYRSERVVRIGAFEETAEADWNGFQYSGNARVGYDLTFGNTRITPIGGIDYLEVQEDDFNETGSSPGIALTVDNRDVSSLRAIGLLEVAHTFERRRGAKLIPMLRAGYRQEFETDPVVTTVSFVEGSSTFDLVSPEIEEGGFVGGAGLSFANPSLIVEIGYDALFEEDFVRHSGGLSFRFIFN